jgi:hypothetical protein
MLNPPHAGDLARTEIVTPLGLCVTAAAQVPWGPIDVVEAAEQQQRPGRQHVANREGHQRQGRQAHSPVVAPDITRISRREGKTDVRRYQPAEAYP